MARYRLRLLLQEFDLPPGETVLGRSPECHVTIDDPLVSREHARIVLNGESVLLFDLGSRNGSKLNGTTFTTPTELRDGDRIRIGNQEIVFSRVTAPRRPGRPTGSLRHCRRCQTPYPAESPSCPNCGYMPANDETLSGKMPVRPRSSSDQPAGWQQTWSLQIHIELVDKALSLMRTADAERAMRRMADAIEERIEAGATILPQEIEPAYERAVRLAAAKGSGDWISWVLATSSRIGRPPTGPTITLLEGAPPIVLDGAIVAFDDAWTRWAERSEPPSVDESPLLDRIGALKERVVARRRSRGGG